MITLFKNLDSLLPQYFLIAFFAANALYDEDRFTPEWWAILALCAALAVLVTFWPVRRAYRLPYLIAEALLIAALMLLEPSFVFLGFLFGAQAGLLLSTRGFFISMGAFTLVVAAVFLSLTDPADAFFSGLGPTIGFISFGYAYHMREKIEAAYHETRRLLDELREAHSKLEAYASQVQEMTVIEERNRLARELHDSVKQQAFAASAQLGAARTAIEHNPTAAADHLLKAEQLMDEVRAELNQMIHQLRPAALTERGLSAALRDWGEEWSRRSGIPLHVQVEDARRLSEETEQALFRIAQEALSNVARHSKAAHAWVEMQCSDSAARICIRDDGSGFDPQAIRDGVGLESMRERAERLPGGKFAFRSSPGQGTTIEVTCEG